MSRAQITDEIGLLLNHRLVNGSLAPSERDRLIALIAQRDGLTTDEATQRVARMEQAADGIALRAHNMAQNEVEAARIGARAVSASLLIGLAATLLGAWFGTRHVRQIVSQTAASYEPVSVYRAQTVHSTAPVRPAMVMNFKGLSFPATRAELLRQARAAGGDSSMLGALEGASDRRYLSMEDLLKELRLSPP